MEIAKTLTNPIVLGGGALIGLVLLMRGDNGNANSPATSGANPAVLSATTQMNGAALNAEMAIHADNVTLARARFGADTTQQAQFLAYLSNNDDNRTSLAVQRNQSTAGVVQSQISATAAQQIDLQQNINRMAMAYSDLGKAHNEALARIAATRSQEDINKANNKAGFLKSIVGGLFQLGTAALTGGTSLIGTAATSFADVAKGASTPIVPTGGSVWA